MSSRSLPTSARSWSTSDVSGATFTEETVGEATSMILSAISAKVSRDISVEEARTILT